MNLSASRSRVSIWGSVFLFALTSFANAGHPVEKLSWGFDNFKSTSLATTDCPKIKDFDWNLYRETYIGAPHVPPANGFDPLFFSLIYGTELARPGNCYGMSLLSLAINTKGGYFGFCAPPVQYAGDLDNTCSYSGGSTSMGPDDDNLRHAINRIHGHQVNLAGVRHIADLLGAGKTRDGNYAYTQVQKHQLALISITASVNPASGGHTMLAYSAVEDPKDSAVRYIYFYDPNYCWADPDWTKWYTFGSNRITITKVTGHWTYPRDWEPVTGASNQITGYKVQSGGRIWSGAPNNLSGGNIMITPVSIAAPKDRTPASLGLTAGQLLGQILISGDGAAIAQITDSRGRRLFVPGTQAIEEDPVAGIGTIVPFTPSDGEGSHPGAELYFMLDDAGAMLDTLIQPGPQGYQFHVGGPRGMLMVGTLSGVGNRDRFLVKGAGSLEPSVTLLNPFGRRDYRVEFTQLLKASERSRIFTISAIQAPPGAPIELGVTENQTALRVTSATASVQFDLTVAEVTRSGVQRAVFTGLRVESGETALVGPENWAAPQPGRLVQFPEALSFDDVEQAIDLAYEPSRGSPGPHFSDARDIGTARGGSTVYDSDSDVYEQTASGTHIGDDGDAFHFAYSPVSGDFDLVVEVVEPRQTGAGCYGLMARRDCGPAGKYSYLQTYSWTYRVAHGDNQSTDAFQTFEPDPGDSPTWLRLVRRGSTLYGFVSWDGAEWRPVGADTWHDGDLNTTLAVGFASAGSEHLMETRFKVHRFEMVLAPLMAALPNDGVEQGDRIQAYDFSEEDGAAPHGFSVQSRGGRFVPCVKNGRLQLADAGAPEAASSAFAARTIDDVESAVWQFDFDLYSVTPPGSEPAGGVTFAMLSGSDSRCVGSPCEALGYEGVGHDLATGRNTSRNSIAVEFDLRNAGSHYEGEGSSHVGVNTANSVTSLAVASMEELPGLLSSSGLHARVVYNRGSVRVFLGPVPPTDTPLIKVLEAEALPLSFGAGTRQATFGFTAGTCAVPMSAAVDNLTVSRLGCDDAPEVAIITGVPQNPVQVGETVTLDGSGSHDGSGGGEWSISFEWSIASGNAEILGPKFGPTVTVAPHTAGPVTVRLTVDDGRCGSGSATAAFTAVGPGAGLELKVSRLAQGLEIAWDSLGRDYFYTLEGTDSLTHPDWTPVADGVWPSDLTRWRVLELESATQFYRVRASPRVVSNELQRGHVFQRGWSNNETMR